MLTRQQEVYIRQQIIAKNPKQLKFDLAFGQGMRYSLIKREC